MSFVGRCSTRLRKGQLLFGDQPVTMQPLWDLLNQLGENALRLHKADLRGDDAMNVKASERVASTIVEEALRQQPPNVFAAHAVAAYLRAIRFAVFAFVDPELPPLMRVYMAWCGICFPLVFSLVCSSLTGRQRRADAGMDGFSSSRSATSPNPIAAAPRTSATIDALRSFRSS